MKPRIETAEILSFRLKVPPQELLRLPQASGAGMGLLVENEDGEIALAQEGAESYLRFRSIGADAMLTEVYLCGDEGGLFFHRVLGALMVRHGGDLHVRLTWNLPERNSQGDYAEVRIHRGATTYPGLSNELSPSLGLGGEAAAPSPAAAAGQEPPRPAFDREVQELLEKARRHWEEYQRLKARKPSS